MFITRKTKYHPILTILLFFAETTSAQFCDTTYFSVTYQDKGLINLSKSFVTPDNGVICLENNNYYDPGLIKFTSQGSVIWSAKYNAPYAANGNHGWTELSFKDAISVDTGLYMCGSVTKHGLFYDNMEVPPPKTVAVLVYANRYGNVVWSKFFDSDGNDAHFITNIYKTKSGDLIAFLARDNNQNSSYSKVICLSSAGILKWVTPLITGPFVSGKFMTSIKRAIRQTADGNIVVADILYNGDGASASTDGEFHFLSFNGTNGSINWESSFQYPTIDSFYVPNIANITELPDGDLSVQTSLDLPTTSQPLPTRKQTNIILDNKGNLKNIFAYYPSNGLAWNIDALNDDNAGTQTILMNDDGNKALLMQVDQNGNINWYKKYGNVNSGLLPSCLSKSGKGYNVFLSNFTHNVQLIRTDQLGNIDCDTTPISIIMEAVNIPVNANKVKTNTKGDDENLGTGGFTTVANFDGPLPSTVDCQKGIPCCKDVIDTTHIHSVSICEGSSYILPDNTVITDSGSYYTTYKTTTGCDSIVYYNVKMYKNPADLYVVADTCLHGQDSLVLKASDGFGTYAWMNEPPSPSPYFTIRDAGTYWVTVSNTCGTNTDSAHVYDNCDFPIYMPNAFTPNHDGLNDVFRVPPQNKDLLVRLTIFNRWGRIIFATTDISKGWDGTINGIEQASGVYIYHLEMKGLTGKAMSQTGTFALVR